MVTSLMGDAQAGVADVPDSVIRASATLSPPPLTTPVSVIFIWCRCSAFEPAQLEQFHTPLFRSRMPVASAMEINSQSLLAAVWVMADPPPHVELVPLQFVPAQL